MPTLKERFVQFEDDYINFEDVPNPLSKRRDLCAFLLLDKLAPSARPLVSAAQHDIIYLDVNLDVLNKNATDEDIHTLVRCGVSYNESYDCLSMNP